MKIKKCFLNFTEFEVNNRQDIENIEWVKENWIQYPEFNLVWSNNPGLINPQTYPTLIMVQGIFESGKKETHAIFLCEGNAEELGLNKWDYNN